jgi:hypothetical protein
MYESFNAIEATSFRGKVWFQHVDMMDMGPESSVEYSIEGVIKFTPNFIYALGETPYGEEKVLEIVPSWRFLHFESVEGA